VDLGGTGEGTRPIASREGSPYEEIQKRNKQGSAMLSTLKWTDEDEGAPMSANR